MDFYQRCFFYKHSLLSFLKKRTHPLYLLSDMHGNIGDHLIWAGTQDLLKMGGIHFFTVPIHQMDQIRQPQATLLIPGSGAFDRLFHEWLPALVLKASDLFKEVIVFPSGFDREVPIVAECLKKTNVYLFAREPISYSSIKVSGRASLCLDCALFFNQFTVRNVLDVRIEKNDSILLALREDQGSLLAHSGFKPNPTMNRDISLTSPTLDGWVDSIRKASTVVTDRLHVAVAAVLFEKKLIYFETYNKKISTYFSYAFRDHFSDRIRSCSLSWLVNNHFVMSNQEKNANG